LLIAIAIVAVVWLLLSHFGTAWLSASNQYQTLPAAPTSTAGVLPNHRPVAQVAALVAEGITLKQATQASSLSQDEAALIAGELEPIAASNDKSASAEYVLLDYAGSKNTSAHSSLENVPVWMIEFQQVSSPGSSSYDLYVFIDANTGNELLAVRV
jgi:hypothetical protein